MTEKAVSIQDTSRIHLIFGDFDNNINIIQKEYKVSIFTRDDEIRIKGDENAVDNAEQVIKTLISTVEKGETPTEQSVRYAISMTNEGKGEEVQTLTADCICVSHTGKPIKAKTVGQSKYVNSIKKNTIVFGVGPAGTQDVSCRSTCGKGVQGARGATYNSYTSCCGGGREVRISAGRPAEQGRPLSASAV